MSRIEKLIKDTCPDGVEYQKLEDVLEYEQPTKYIVSNTEYDNSNPIPVLTAGRSFILGYTDEIDGVYKASKEKPVIIFDDFTTSFHWVDFEFKVKSSAMKMLRPRDWNKYNFRYLYYAMCTIEYVPVEHSRQWISNYSQFEIPVPPIEVQQEIVRILDKFTELEAGLQAELEARKKQYEYYREMLLDETVIKIKLGSICKVITKGTTPKSFTDTGVNFIKTEAFDGNRINKIKLSHIDVYTHTTFLKRSILEEGDILLTIAGATIGKCAIVTSDVLPANTNQALAIIRLNADINRDYIMHVIRSNNMKNYINKKVKGSAQPNLTLELINEFTLPLPSLEEQDQVVIALDKFDNFCNDSERGLPAEIEARHKQYEYYRDKLLTFERKVV